MNNNIICVYLRKSVSKIFQVRPKGAKFIDGNHRMEKARRMGINSMLAYRLNVEQHMKFLTNKKAYVAYIEYWNSKLK